MDPKAWVHEHELKRLKIRRDKAAAALEWIETHQPADDKQALVKICGMFGSSHAGERAAAAQAADRLVRSKKLTWADVIEWSP